MKTLIINPPGYHGIDFVREGRCEQRLSSYQYVLLPVSLPSIAAILRQRGLTVQIIDAVAEKFDWPQLRRAIGDFGPDLIILNVSTVTFTGDMDIAEKIKAVNPAVHLSVIGVHVTAMPVEALSYPIDSVIKGEPELTALELALALAHHTDLAAVRGLSYKQDGQMFHNRRRPFIKDLDSLPFPARDLVKNEKYLMAMSDQPHTVLLSSRGCNQNCVFCTARQYYGRRLRLRSAKNIVSEMAEIKTKYHINYITMWSDTFTLNKQFVMELCREILSRQLKVIWMCNSRVDTIDAEMLCAMKQAGCRGIAFGVESGVQAILDQAGKRTNLNQIRRAFTLTRQAGIESLAHFVLGLPGENKATIAQTLRFARQLDPDYAQFYCAVPFPGTPFYHQAVKEGWLTTNRWENFEINQAIIATPQLSRQDLARARRRGYVSFYFRPKYLYKQFKKINSLKDLNFVASRAVKFIKDWGLK